MSRRGRARARAGESARRRWFSLEGLLGERPTLGPLPAAIRTYTRTLPLIRVRVSLDERSLALEATRVEIEASARRAMGGRS